MGRRLGRRQRSDPRPAWSLTPIGVEPRRINYVAFSGGGESLSAILGGQVSVRRQRLAEFAPQIEAARLRALAISSAERLPGTRRPNAARDRVSTSRSRTGARSSRPRDLRPPTAQRLEKTFDAMVHADRMARDARRYRWLDRYLEGRRSRASSTPKRCASRTSSRSSMRDAIAARWRRSVRIPCS
jgi:putative tricarboxylic transport membrane protein